MDDLWCCRCDVKLVETKEIAIKFGMIPLPNAYGYRCPSCGVELLPKSLVLGDLASAEKMMAGK